MRILKYGYFGEDEAHRIFLANYLELLVLHLGKAEELIFDFDEIFFYKFRGGKKSEVDARFAEAVQEGFVNYQHDIFFVGRDLDTFTNHEFKDKIKAMKSQLSANFHDKTFLMIPVQCIEHWLWYIKIKSKNPSSTKNESLESKPRKDAKIALYGSASATNQMSNPIVEELSMKLDFEYLESRSESFKIFHKEVFNFINSLETS